MYGVCLTKPYEDSTDWLKCSDLLSQAGSKLHAMAISRVTRLSLHVRKYKTVADAKIKLHEKIGSYENTYILYKKYIFLYVSVS